MAYAANIALQRPVQGQAGLINRHPGQRQTRDVKGRVNRVVIASVIIDAQVDPLDCCRLTTGGQQDRCTIGVCNPPVDINARGPAILVQGNLPA